MLVSTELTTTSPPPLENANPLAVITREDRTYELYRYRCPHCQDIHYRVMRTAGAFLSMYWVPKGFEPDMFEQFVDDVHSTMSIHAGGILESTKELLNECNSAHGIMVDGSYLSVLQDYARQRLIQLQRTGQLKTIQDGTPRTKAEAGLIAAFELGYAASELRLKDDYEDAIFEGWRLQEGREAGQEAAAKAKRQQSKTTRSAILAAALAARAADTLYQRNDTALARYIEGLKLDALKRGDGRSIGYEAILKHMRELRHEDKL